MTNFQETWPGANGAPWPSARWGSIEASGVVTADQTGTNEGRIAATSSVHRAGRAIAYEDASPVDIADFEWDIEFTPHQDGTSGSPGLILGFSFRCQGTDWAHAVDDNNGFNAVMPYNGYVLRVYLDGTWLMRRVVDGATTNLDGGSNANISDGDTSRLIVRAEGSTIEWKLWRPGIDAEPAFSSEIDSEYASGNIRLAKASGTSGSYGTVLYEPFTVTDLQTSSQLATPTSWTFTKTTDEREVNGSWDAVQDADHYEWEVEEETDPETWVAFDSGTTVTTSFSLDDTNGVDWNTTYRSRVRAMPEA